MEKELNEIKFDLKKYGQEHLLNNFDKLDESKQKRLLEQLSNIDYELINGLYNGTKKEIKNEKDTIEPIEYLDKFKLNEKYKKLIEDNNESLIFVKGDEQYIKKVNNNLKQLRDYKGIEVIDCYNLNDINGEVRNISTKYGSVLKTLGK